MRKAEKEAELVEMVAKGLVSMDPSAADIAAEQIVARFCSITEPESPAPSMERIIMSRGGLGGGRSTKPGNIKLNMRHLLVTAAAGTLALSSLVAAPPWTLPLAALVLWNDLLSKLEEDIQEREATVFWAMWLNRDEQSNTVPKSGLLDLVNAERAQHERPPLSAVEHGDAVRILQHLGCIRQSKRHQEAWWLQEWVRVSWT